VYRYKNRKALGCNVYFERNIWHLLLVSNGWQYKYMQQDLKIHVRTVRVINIHFKQNTRQITNSGCRIHLSWYWGVAKYITKSTCNVIHVNVHFCR
jgi:hypothetical protein